jgi:hypothetical protein
VTDPVALQAELEAKLESLESELARTKARLREFESLDTIHPPADTGRDHDAAFAARVYLQAERASELLSVLVDHLKGRVDGMGVDIAQSQEFERETTKALTEIAATQREHGRSLKTISANVSLIASETRRHGGRISAIESREPPWLSVQQVAE